MSDAQQRERALETERSFLVQAPAGSGKTELLIQRYLSLLATVEIPEQVIAITFTRKATAQMRERVLAALAAADRQERPSRPHQQRTYELARAALDRDRRRDWSLIEQPARLKIDTLDALNVWLAQRLPVSTDGIAGARIVEDASDCYEDAGRRLMRRLREHSAETRALRTLLEHSEASAERMVALMARLLATRDQWLHHLFASDEAQLRAHIERSLRRSFEEEMREVSNLLPASAVGRLVPLLRHAAEHASDKTEVFGAWSAIDALPAPGMENMSAWKALPELLLTMQGTWRKRFHAFGFSGEFSRLGVELKELIASFSESEGLRLALIQLRNVPESLPGPAWWDAVSALRTALRHMVAELQVLFAERNAVDFLELALAAQRALGSATRPSDLLLALDHRIRHVLVDEFQDTSRSQIRLLELLTSGWEPGDGRSLFLVGDPMQSIYRFRNADMSLFLRAKHRGIGDIQPEILQLNRNFRSAPTLIDWVNDMFAGIFPGADNLKSGAARFSPCVAAREPSSDQIVRLHALRGSESAAETRLVAEIVAEERARSASASVAVLVRSRSHLEGLREHLLSLGIEAQAVQLDAPDRHQVTHDLIGLTRALTHRGDRIAWLAVLRAPWCGLTWRDLLALCRGDSDSAVWALMHDATRTAALTEDGQTRLKRLRSILQAAFLARSDYSLSRWVRRTWVALGGHECLLKPDDFDRAGHFFAILRDNTVRGDLDDPAALHELFGDPSAIPERPTGSGIEIMTIHRAKGLEFDTVIVPGLGRESKPDESRAMVWHEQAHADGGESVVLAPYSANSDGGDSLTRWLKGIEMRKAHSERARLLYVAATRARERLHLVGQLREGRSSPPARSLLALLWPQVSDAFKSAKPAPDSPGNHDDEFEPVLSRLAKPAPAPQTAPAPQEDGERRPHFRWAGQAALQVGVVVHQWLHTFARDGIECWNAERVRAARDRHQAELRLLGVDEAELPEASRRVMQALLAVLDDPTGRWILKGHAEAESELSVTRAVEGRIENLRLDRTFVDDTGIRWIVDYKTSRHEGGSVDEFLDAEVERYRGQLERYARTMASIDGRPVRLGLYFPLLRAFREWRPQLDDPLEDPAG